MINKLKIERFLKRLEGKEGCAFTAKTWHCDGTFKKSKAILKKMKFSEEETGRILDIAQEHGGYCDCEILFNAAEVLKEEF